VRRGRLKLWPVVVPVRRVCRIAWPSREVVAIVSVIRTSGVVVVGLVLVVMLVVLGGWGAVWFGASVYGEPPEMEMSVMDAECGL
jgi:hypothetical protein